MKDIILISKCWEKAEIGYISTFVNINRKTNAVLSVSYNWYEDFTTDSESKSFDSFESLNTFIDELVVDARNEAELNALESQSYEA